MRLIWHSLRLCLALTAFVGTTVIAGRHDSAPDHLAILHLTDCTLPCWIGIVPGQTTLDQAGERIDAVYERASDLGFSVDIATMPGVLLVTLNRRSGSPGAISILLSTNGDTVIRTILFDFNQD